MDCFFHNVPIQESGTCPQCLELNYPSYRNSLIESLGFDALEFNCKWTEVEGVKHLMAQFGITNEEMEEAIEKEKAKRTAFEEQKKKYYKQLKDDERQFLRDEEKHFVHETPLIELSSTELGHLQKLKDKGLAVHRNTNGPYRQGFTVAKPKGVGGHTRIFYEDQDHDAPIGWLFPTSDLKWHFLVKTFCGPGNFEQGEFQNTFETIGEAVEDILDYYFGSPFRVNPPIAARHWAKHKKVLLERDSASMKK